MNKELESARDAAAAAESDDSDSEPDFSLYDGEIEEMSELDKKRALLRTLIVKNSLHVEGAAHERSDVARGCELLRDLKKEGASEELLHAFVRETHGVLRYEENDGIGIPEDDDNGYQPQIEAAWKKLKKLEEILRELDGREEMFILQLKGVVQDILTLRSERQHLRERIVHTGQEKKEFLEKHQACAARHKTLCDRERRRVNELTKQAPMQGEKGLGSGAAASSTTEAVAGTDTASLSTSQQQRRQNTHAESRPKTVRQTDKPTAYGFVKGFLERKPLHSGSNLNTASPVAVKRTLGKALLGGSCSKEKATVVAGRKQVGTPMQDKGRIAPPASPSAPIYTVHSGAERPASPPMEQPYQQHPNSGRHSKASSGSGYDPSLGKTRLASTSSNAVSLSGVSSHTSVLSPPREAAAAIVLSEAPEDGGGGGDVGSGRMRLQQSSAPATSTSSSSPRPISPLPKPSSSSAFPSKACGLPPTSGALANVSVPSTQGRAIAAGFRKGELVDYVGNEGEISAAVIQEVHYDAGPPYYTIKRLTTGTEKSTDILHLRRRSDDTALPEPPAEVKVGRLADDVELEQQGEDVVLRDQPAQQSSPLPLPQTNDDGGDHVDFDELD